MSRWERIETTSGGRPVLLPDEKEVIVQNNVGIYEGKYKAEGYQNGRVYLTSQRICYVDNINERTNSIGLPLDIVESTDFYGGFLRSCPKITLHLNKGSNGDNGTSGGPGSRNSITPIFEPVTWVCPICFFVNILDSPYSDGSQLPKCLTCGIKATTEILEQAIKSSKQANKQASSPNPPSSGSGTSRTNTPVPEQEGFACPRCTFINHPSLHFCELCGARLVSERLPPGLDVVRIDSPGPSTTLVPQSSDVDINTVKLSFRGGGEKLFNEQLKAALKKHRKTISSKPLNKQFTETSRPDTPNSVSRGIHGLELEDEQSRQQNGQVLGDALEDLNTLMGRAKQVVKLAEQYAKYLEKLDENDNSTAAEARRSLRMSSEALGLTTSVVTKEMSKDEEIYHSELARQIVEFLTSSTQGPPLIEKQGGIISLVDLFALYNRARGVSLISPKDLYSACKLFESLKLPITLRKFKSGLLVVQQSYRTPDYVVRNIVNWVRTCENHQGPEYKGVSSQEASTWFGYSIIVATEELEMTEQQGALCRDEQVSGLRFFENKFLSLKG